MGLLSDFFIATVPELDALGPDLDITALQRVETTGIESTNILTLDKIIMGGDDNFPQLVKDAGEEGPWLFSIRPELTSAIANLDGPGMHKVAKQWSETEDWQLDAASHTAVLRMLENVANLARVGKQQDKGLFLWVCV